MNLNFPSQHLASQVMTFFRGQQNQTEGSTEKKEKERLQRIEMLKRGKENSDTRAQGSEKGRMA